MSKFLLFLTVLSITQIQAQWATMIGDSVTLRGLTSKGDTIIAGTTTGRIFVSPDLGETWTERSTGLPTQAVNNVGVTANGSLLCNIAYKIWRSTDWQTWEEVYVSQIGSGHSLAIIDSLIMFGTNYNGALHVSMDNGDTWSVLGTGFITGVGASGDTLLMGKWSNGLHRSWDHGANWEQVTTYTAGINAISSDGRFIASESRLYRRNLSHIWGFVLEAQGLMQFQDIAVSLPYVAAGGLATSIYLSQSGGVINASWFAIPMPGGSARQLEFAGGYLFAAGHGLFRLDHQVWLAIEQHEADSPFLIYPNPTNGMLHIVPNGDQGRSMDIHVHDATGRIVRSMTGLRSSEVQLLDLGGHAPGAYSLLMIGEDGVRQTNKFVLE